MSGKQIFIWAVIVGLALAGGIDGIASLVIWVAAFWLLDKAYDAVAAFSKGFKQALAPNRPIEYKTPTRPVLRVVK